MLVRFRSGAGDITMFGDVALKLIKMMGHSGTLPSAMLAKDIPAALERLTSAVAAAPGQPAPGPGPGPGNKKVDEDPAVSLQQRAFPLIELLGRCVENECDLLWDQQR